MTPSSCTSGGYRVLLLAADVKRLPARDEEVEVGAGSQEVREFGSGLDQVLEVVEEQQQVLVGDVLGESVLGAERL